MRPVPLTLLKHSSEEQSSAEQLMSLINYHTTVIGVQMQLWGFDVAADGPELFSHRECLLLAPREPL